jgi:hypothetical protein
LLSLVFDSVDGSRTFLKRMWTSRRLHGVTSLIIVVIRSRNICRQVLARACYMPTLAAQKNEETPIN